MKCHVCGTEITEIEDNGIPVYRQSEFNNKLGIETVYKGYCGPTHSLDDYISDKRKNFMNEKPCDIE